LSISVSFSNCRVSGVCLFEEVRFEDLAGGIDAYVPT